MLDSIGTAMPRFVRIQIYWPWWYGLESVMATNEKKDN